MRTFHIGGVAKVEQSRHDSKNSGKIRFVDLNFAKSEDANICTSKTGELVIEDPTTSLELERYPLTLGAKIYCDDGQEIKNILLLAEWIQQYFLLLLKKKVI